MACISRKITVDRVVVITTSRGADQARLQLVVGDEGKRSPCPNSATIMVCRLSGFTEADIRIVPGETVLPLMTPAVKAISVPWQISSLRRCAN